MVIKSLKRFLAITLVGLLIGLPAGPPVQAQAPVGGAGTAPPVQPLSAQQLEDLVGRIALYPDDLVAIVLPASTYPLDIVQADRFLQRLKQDPKLQPDTRWDQSIRSLLNYPEVVTMMSQDLDWTQSLGEAVTSQQSDVLAAIQQFRAKASSAGNLKTDDKQIIVQEQQTIKIVPANPEVIYVPQYQPSAVVVYQPAPPFYYYPTPYPVYYYPYPPGFAFATGFFFGAATAWACNWGGHHIENNVNINRTTNLNVNRTNVQYQQRADQARQRGQQGAGGRPTTLPAGGGQGAGSAWQSQRRPGEVSQARVSPRTSEARPGYGGSPGQSRGDAYSNYGRGPDATRDANRGVQSRGSGSSGGNRPQSLDSRGGAGSSMGSGGPRGGSASTMGRGAPRGGGSSSMGSGASRGGGSSMGGGASRGGGSSMGGSASRGGGGSSMGSGASRGGGGGGSRPSGGGGAPPR
jgi:hypothetical protein